ncbi:MAG: hypothetical protein ACRDPK_13780 [Carbonactinosporaceae bacterium]
MGWLQRSRHGGLPGEVRAALSLERGERVLAQGRDQAGGRVVATDRALYVLTGHGSRTRLAWESVGAAVWDEDTAMMDVRESPPALARHQIALSAPGFLPEVVRERVTTTIVVNQHVALHGGRGVRVVARRAPGTDEIRWSLTLDPGLDPDDPQVRSAAHRALADVRAQTGI